MVLGHVTPRENVVPLKVCGELQELPPSLEETATPTPALFAPTATHSVLLGQSTHWRPVVPVTSTAVVQDHGSPAVEGAVPTLTTPADEPS